MSSLNKVLLEINESLQSTSDSLEKLQTIFNGESTTEDSIIKRKIQNDILGKEPTEKVSLLSLKNASGLAYINSLLLILHDKLDVDCVDPTAAKGREKSIENRIVLERGVKPLEKKLQYQLDKLARTYTRMEKEYIDAEKRALEKSANNTNDSDSNSDHDDDSDSSSSEEEEEMTFKPNTDSFITRESESKIKKHRKSKTVEEEEEEEGKSEDEGSAGVYKPPKINAVLPPTMQRHFEDKFNAKNHKDRSAGSRMQAMEEYLKESSEQPDWESSIGADIVDHGRGGIKSRRDTEKDRRVQEYEESNMTRLSLNGSKKEKKQQKQRQRYSQMNMIGGEDFSIFNSKRKLEDSTSRRGNKKSRNAWERAKKRL